MAAAIAYGFWVGRERPRAYFGLMLFLTAAVVGVFASQDLLLFYVFFEAMMIPLYVLIGVWGGPGRLGATVKFVIYTMAGSLLMLAAVIVFGLSKDTFDLVDTGPSDSTWLFLGFAVAFAVKAPLFPLHGWLPDAYRESPPEVAAVLSGVISKAAVFGFIRICLGEVPRARSTTSATSILALAVVGLVYGSLLAFRAPDVRGVIAYSSLAQMGLITIGIFAENSAGLSGAVLQVGQPRAHLGHALPARGRDRAADLDRRALDRLGGMARGRPALATVLMATGIIALAVPGSSAFAGEFLILAGVFRSGWGWAVAGATGIVLAAMYMLRLISAVLHQEPGPAGARRRRSTCGPPSSGSSCRSSACLLALSAWPAAISGNSFPVEHAPRFEHPMT